MRTAYVLERLLYLDAKRATSKRVASRDAFRKPLLRDPGKKIYSDYSGCGNLTSSLDSASEVESAGLSVQ